MRRRRSPKLIFWFTIVTAAALCLVSVAHSTSTLHPQDTPLFQRINHIIRNDLNRQSLMISRKRLLIPLTKPSSSVNASKPEQPPGRPSHSGGVMKMRLRAGRDEGTGQYFTDLMVGTPAQKFTVVMDTGSELTWVNCRYRRRKLGSNCTGTGRRRVHGRRVFHADLSSSFRTVPCFSQTCKIDLMNLFSLTACPTPLTPCSYDYRYVDGSAAKGIFSKETVTEGLSNGRKSRIQEVLVGCSSSFRGQSFSGADGVMGLAFSHFSFTSKATRLFQGKFSYCLVDHLSHKNVSSYLIFGSTIDDPKHHSTTLLAPKRHTRLELDLIPPFYALNVVGISIGDKMLDIPEEAWDATRGGGTILDTGTSLTFLADQVYKPLMSGLEAYVSKLKRIKLRGVPMEHCFNSTGYREREVAQVTFHFGDGGRFEPHRKSYVIAVAPGIKCLGFVAAGKPATNIVGNIMQQNYLWEYDVVATTLAFAPSTCT